MLLVTANWGLSDGTLASVPASRLVSRLRTEVRRAVLRSGFGQDGRYRPVDAVDLVFAGDTFDWLVSRSWTGDVRPWQAGPRAAAARREVAAGALHRGGRLLATLAAWGRRGIEVPLADPLGRPRPHTRRPVTVRVTLLSGDRDRWLDRLDAAPAAAAVGRSWSDGGCLVQHGESLDPLYARDCGEDGGEPTLGESIAVDLVARFGGVVDGTGLPRPAAATLLRRIAAGHPLDAGRRLGRWLEPAGGGPPVAAGIKRRVIDTWRRSVAGWHRAARRLASAGAAGVDVAGRIAAWLDAMEAPPQPADVLPPDRPAADGMEVPPAETVILGHGAAADGAVTAAPVRRIVRVGSIGLSGRTGLGDDDEGPVIVGCRRGVPGRWGDVLPFVVCGTAGGDADGDAGPRGVWLSDAAGRSGRWIDAA